MKYEGIRVHGPRSDRVRRMDRVRFIQQTSKALKVVAGHVSKLSC